MAIISTLFIPLLCTKENMKFILLVSITVYTGYTLGSPILNDVETEWIKFKEHYGKQYKSLLEETDRKQIFASNYEMILTHNKLYKQGLETYFMNINEKADMTDDEMKQLNGYKSSNTFTYPISKTVFKPKEGVVVPESFDWRDKGAVSVVKNQGSCGSCWAFSTTGTVEGQYFLKAGKLVELSEQNLIDCANTDGCEGGNMFPAYNYIYNNDGLDSEHSYPYIKRDDFCTYSVKNNVTSIKAYEIIKEGSEEDLKAAVAQVGPISVAIDARGIHFYSGEIYYNTKCMVKDEDLDHAVLVVGYGTENGQDYWLVKNSWGANWGLQGFIKMARNRNNNCGIATSGSYPVMY